jgi:DNA processing protein
VVVEAGRRSGALITASWALEQGRDCFLVPGPLDAPTSEGCHAFLRSFPGQTRVVCGIPELIEDLGLGGVGDRQNGAVDEAGDRGGRPGAAAPGAGAGAALAILAPVERSIAELLTSGPATVDDLARRSGLSGGAILSALTLLELRGLVAGSYGRYVPAGALARWPGRREARRA